MNVSHKQLKIIEDFYIVMQPIFKVSPEKKDKVMFYEILLRSKKTKKFPGEIFFNLVKSKSGNRIVLSFFEKQLKETLQEHPCARFSINFEIIQFNSSQTHEFFERMNAWAPNIIVELTERSYPIYGNDYLWKAIKKIREMGYSIFIDDIGTGQNILSVLQDNINLVDGIKYTGSHLQKDYSQVGVSLLSYWDTLARNNNLAFVFEGVETIATQLLLYKMGIVYQQGWLFGKPIEDMSEAQIC
ncbi:diguanylate phosphodiesterase [Leuconostoc mesenteroides P45]|uniref:EAL domain-containing protein n=1 Tax=Leuconostoc mesenteroides TaxID=1245 RepID=UPI00050440DD|nr:EAL domain-containing protein [Leuconostoc mesenteroides]KGB51241.1 diguanylate phosphodiesterase [Leuconostoc mesenteroides P45]